MKQFLLLLSFVTGSFFMSSYAAAPKDNPVITAAFENRFAGATDIQWEQIGVLHKATFERGGQVTSAFYNNDGELIAQTKNVSSTRLPKALQTGLRASLNGYWISDAFVVTVEGADTYYAVLENATTTMMLKSTGGKKWTVYQKTDK